MGSGGKSSQQGGGWALPFANQLMTETGPMRRTTLDQVTQALTTGGVGARMPMIQAATSQSANALGESLRSLRGDLGGAGLANTPYGQRQLASTELAGRQQIAGIGPGIAQQMAGQGAGMTDALSQAIMGGFSGVHKGSSKSFA